MLKRSYIDRDHYYYYYYYYYYCRYLSASPNLMVSVLYMPFILWSICWLQNVPPPLFLSMAGKGGMAVLQDSFG